MTLNKSSGQAAVEYLMTYGWMLLVLSVVSGALYSMYGVECVKSASGFASTSMTVDQFGASADNNLSIVFENQDDERVDFDEVVIQHDGEEIPVRVDSVIEPGDTETVDIRGISPSSQCNEMDLTLRYDIGPLGNQLSDQRISGTVTSEIDFADLPEPAQPANYTAEYNP